LRTLYKRLALRLYLVGKIEHEKYWEGMMLKRVAAGNDTRFTTESTIINLADDPNKIKIGKNCHIAGLMLVYGYGGSITMGDHCSLSSFSRIVSTKKIVIGNRVLIAH